MLADLLTMPLPCDRFEMLRNLMGLELLPTTIQTDKSSGNVWRTVIYKCECVNDYLCKHGYVNMVM